MAFVVSLVGFRPSHRYDGQPWTGARLEEGVSEVGPFVPIETYVFGVGGQPAPDADPAHPQARNFTTENAALVSGFYRVVFTDADNNEETAGPVALASTVLYASPDTVRAALSSDAADPGTAASLTDDELYDAIRDAQAEVDARVPGAPFSDVPDLVATLTRDIAAYLATLTFRKGDPVAADDPVVRRYDRARSLLGDLAAGRAMLGSEGGADAATEAYVVNAYEGDLFGLEDAGIGVASDRRTPLSWDLDSPLGW